MNSTPTQIIDHLRQEIEQMPAALQAAAKYIIDYPGDFGLDPIRTTATRIGVSSNVLVRLAQRMGFDGFEAFRTPFRNALVTDRESDLGQDWLTALQSEDAFGTFQAKLVQNEQNVVTRSLRLMKPDKVREAIQYLTTSRRCFVTATRASYALAYYFSYTGRMAHPGIQLAPRHVGSATDDLLDADHRDSLIAITVHPYSADTIQSMRFAKQQGLRLILISDSDVIAPGVEPDVAFTVSTRALHPFSCFTGAMAVLECLLGHLFDVGGDAARQRLEAYQKAREDTGAYWQPSKTPRLRRT
ncbi:putative DNA-binding transcriptional regulator [Ruegeria denitrificans]|uniref:Putative DNA-binding transcriptional regulator n=1 Tax=Ruegeria denitrificans TaxID=1715692 RepID=A0A0P1I851_9RHOB|nr:MurR/RpiR family transcriptional regulator [Ruegeria denitrificans]CUJ96700.1 putative DNA-binding transcriptional regulator [Ruegeria denitrificans]